MKQFILNWLRKRALKLMLDERYKDMRWIQGNTILEEPAKAQATLVLLKSIREINLEIQSIK